MIEPVSQEGYHDNYIEENGQNIGAMELVLNLH